MVRLHTSGLKGKATTTHTGKRLLPQVFATLWRVVQVAAGHTDRYLTTTSMCVMLRTRDRLQGALHQRRCDGCCPQVRTVFGSAPGRIRESSADGVLLTFGQHSKPPTDRHTEGTAHIHSERRWDD